MIKNQQGFSLVTVIFVMLVLGSMGVGLSSSLSPQVVSSNMQNQGDQAFFIADGGLQYVIKEYFADDSDFSDNVAPTPAPFGNTPITLGSGQFWVEYSGQSSTATTVTVTSRVGSSVRAVQQTVTKPASASGPYAYALHGNGNLSMQGGTGVIDGDLSAGGNISKQDDWTINGATYAQNSEDAPDIDLDDYIAMTSSTYNGNLAISGNYNTSIRVTGNLTINSNTTINANIVANGNITIGSNVTINGFVAAGGNISMNNETGLNFSGAVIGPEGTALAVLAANGNISMNTAKNGSASVNGYIVTGGNMSFNAGKDSTLAINGFVLAHGNASISNQGIVTITYDENLAISASSGGSGSGLTLSGWKEV